MKEDNTKEQIKKDEIKEQIKNEIIKNNQKVNAFYTFTLGSLLINIIIFISSLFFLQNAINYEAPIKYITVDKDRKIVENNDLSKFSKTNNEIKQWFVDALDKTFTYNFTNIEEHPLSVKKFFDEKGFLEFKNQFENSSDIILVKKDKAVSSVIKINPPKILKEGVLDGVALIRLQTEMSQYFQAKDGTRRENYKVTVVIGRKDFSTYEDGLAIISILREKNE